MQGSLEADTLFVTLLSAWKHSVHPSLPSPTKKDIERNAPLSLEEVLECLGQSAADHLRVEHVQAAEAQVAQRRQRHTDHLAAAEAQGREEGIWCVSRETECPRAEERWRSGSVCGRVDLFGVKKEGKEWRWWWVYHRL